MIFNKKTIRDVDVKGKNVLVRVDYNVPLKDGKVENDLRLRATFPTINYLLDHGAKKVILMSHLGRPDGQYVPELSLRPVADALAALLLDKTVRFIDWVYGENVQNAVDALPDGGILLLENLRYVPEEEENSTSLAQSLASDTRANLFVEDGFAVVHRAHASTEAITHVLPSVAGFLLEKEVNSLTGAIENPKRPLLAIIGGAKVEDKEPLIQKFAEIADQVAIGGKIAIDYVSDDPKIYVAEDFAYDDAGIALDIGPRSVIKIVRLINNAETIIWNGVLGRSEDIRFSLSSKTIAEALGKAHDKTTIIGGGDTASFIEEYEAKNPGLKYTLISTGGGASLELLLDKPLPGVESLRNKDPAPAKPTFARTDLPLTAPTTPINLPAPNSEPRGRFSGFFHKPEPKNPQSKFINFLKK
jgi:phosphoglycerate kinase